MTDQKNLSEALSASQQEDFLLLEEQHLEAITGGAGNPDGPKWVLGIGGAPVKQQPPHKVEPRQGALTISLPPWNIQPKGQPGSPTFKDFPEIIALPKALRPSGGTDEIYSQGSSNKKA
jgi:hypothetical protein